MAINPLEFGDTFKYDHVGKKIACPDCTIAINPLEFGEGKFGEFFFFERDF